MSRTIKPCPGCGKQEYHRAADKVCSRCALAIQNWAEHVAKTNADPDLTDVKLLGAPHWYPGFYFGGPRHPVEGFDETRRELSRLFWELGERCCTEAFDWKDAPEAHTAEPLYTNPR